ncbi:MAG: phage holin family protein, partial [Acidobacteriota bacterium]
MVAQFLVLTAVAFLAPQILPGVKVKGISAAALVALSFAVLNLLLGWILTTVLTLTSLPLLILTLGLFEVVITALVNGLLLKLADRFLDSFDLDGWLPAFGMGLLFALGGWLARALT